MEVGWIIVAALWVLTAVMHLRDNGRTNDRIDALQEQALSQSAKLGNTQAALLYIGGRWVKDPEDVERFLHHFTGEDRSPTDG